MRWRQRKKASLDGGEKNKRGQKRLGAPAVKHACGCKTPLKGRSELRQVLSNWAGRTAKKTAEDYLAAKKGKSHPN